MKSKDEEFGIPQALKLNVVKAFPAMADCAAGRA